jgi:tRNA (guanine-N7-)-methyltransferase
MARHKLARFAHNTAAHNVIEPGKELFEKVRKNWDKEYFKNGNPLVLELACGRGEYTVGLAKEYPNKNFIGFDIKGARIWKGSKMAIENGYTNVAFYRHTIDFLEEYFEKGEVSEIWVVFPDPRPLEKDEKRRLVHQRYVDMYKNVMSKGGIFNFKTDNRELFDYGLEVIKANNPQNLIYTHDLYASDYLSYHHGIQTKYELLFLNEGKKINYLRCEF